MVKTTFEWIGHILAGLIILYTIFYGSKTDLMGVSLLLGLCYSARVYLAAGQAVLYSAVFLLSIAYLLFIEQVLGVAALALCWLPVFLILQLLGPDPFHLQKLFKKSSPTDEEEEGSAEDEDDDKIDLVAPLGVSTRIVSAALAGYLVWHQGAVTNAFVLVIPFVLLALYDLRLVVRFENSWYLYSSAVIFSGAYYFFLRLVIDGPINVIMAFWAALAVVFVAGAFLLSRKDKEYSEGMFSAAFTIAAIAMAVVVLATFVQNRIEPIQSIAATMLVQPQPVPFDQLPTAQAPAAPTVLAAAEQGYAANLGGVLIFLVAAFVFACMRIKYDRNEFVYMLVLLLGLVGYFFVVLVEDPMYRSLVNYLVYGLLFMGVYFVYRVIKEFFDVSWSLADFLSEHYTRILYAFIPVALILIYFLFDYTMAVTENSHFCGSCHLMKAQFDSWKKDLHSQKGVACFDCHYSPGFTNFLKGRTSGVVMVVKNFTGLSKSKFPANVSDDSCKKCHMDGTLQDRARLDNWITYKKDIKFNHKVMLHQKVSGIELKCTSCHNHYRYDVDSSHLYTREDVCYSCHLMKRKQETGTAVGNCYTCHYRESIEKDLNSLVTIGAGEVTKDKCFHCHWDADEFDDTDYQHKVHVSGYQDFTKSGIECLSCHEPIKHGDLSKLINP